MKHQGQPFQLYLQGLYDPQLYKHDHQAGLCAQGTHSELSVANHSHLPSRVDRKPSQDFRCPRQLDLCAPLSLKSWGGWYSASLVHCRLSQCWGGRTGLIICPHMRLDRRILPSGVKAFSSRKLANTANHDLLEKAHLSAHHLNTLQNL